MENTQHVITKKWLDANRTAKGAFTKKQVQALGIKWPPTSGWMKSIVGEFISSDKAREFENCKSEYAEFKPLKYKKILKSIESLDEKQLKGIVQKIEQLLTK